MASVLCIFKHCFQFLNVPILLLISTLKVYYIFKNYNYRLIGPFPPDGLVFI